tara:strand:+ start:120 stop:1199 length:1080 start_codon:yes stop_codon:yes gene_type:complete
MAKYQIDEFTILTDSGGRTLISPVVRSDDITITNTIKSLSPDYFTNYFGSPIQGSIAGYVSAGSQPSGVALNDIETFPFSTDTNASAAGTLTISEWGRSGQSSSTHGYSSGGYVNNNIDKFPFASTPVTATDVGDLTVARSYSAGHHSRDNGYASGGTGGYSPPPPGYPLFDVVDKFPFSTDANATDVGNLTSARGRSSGQSSSTHGYSSGAGDSPPNISNEIEKFPFSSDANSTDVGDIISARAETTGQSSATYGYVAGGWVSGSGSGTGTNIIEKFPFSSDANSADVGDLTIPCGNSKAGASSTASGYTSGGQGGPPFGPSVQRATVIDKFPFSTDANATDVGDLSKNRRDQAGQQV